MVPLIAPLYLLAIRGMVQAYWRERDWLPATWALSFLLGLSALGVIGYTFQMRYTTPALPGLALAVAAIPWDRGRGLQFALFAGLGLITLAVNDWIISGLDDIFPLLPLLIRWTQGTL